MAVPEGKKEKIEFLTAEPSVSGKIEAAQKEGKKVIVYQYALLTEEHVKAIKYYFINNDSELIEVTKDGELELLVMYGLPELLSKVRQHEKVKIFIMYCHGLLELNHLILINSNHTYKTPDKKEYEEMMRQVAGCPA